MKHPDIDKLRAVIEAMKAVVADNPRLLLLRMDSANDPWSGFATSPVGLYSIALEHIDAPHALADGEYNPDDEADRFACYLGFDGADDLSDWARMNSQIWGNGKGGVMFHDPGAFGWSGNVIQAVRIINTWGKVLGRLENVGGKANDS